MSFLKRLLRRDPAHSAARHERLAREYQREGRQKRAAEEWASAGRNYAKVPNYRRARECYLHAAQLFYSIGDAPREEEALRRASDMALEEEDYQAAAQAADRLLRVGTRLRNNRLLLYSLSLKTLALLASNELAKAKETLREAERIDRRASKRDTPPLYRVAQIVATRFINGEPAPTGVEIPGRAGASEPVKRLADQLISIYRDTMDATATISLSRSSTPIRTKVTGKCTVTSPVPLRVVQAQLITPSNFALPTPPSLQPEEGTNLSGSFAVEAHLPGEFTVGPLIILLQARGQHFYLKSQTVSLRVEAAKPRLHLEVESSDTIYPGEEFELLLRIVNDSHGDASDVELQVTLPPELEMRTGTLEKRIVTLPAQQQVQFPLIVAASEPGTYEGTVECRYVGPGGGRPRTTTSSFTITVQMPQQNPKD